MLEQLKEEILKVCRILNWKPTDVELVEIARQLSKLHSPTLQDVHVVVAKVCPDQLYLDLQGIDNSEIKTLLALAIQVAKSKG
ncbi:hypothetical protein [Pseudomonas sp. Larv2_ips]|uniref:hypothetical protein n=1 Tax=Pseudomonas sp. Larv2_ips TaxID=1896942 RepID=UPI000E6B7614|nr:hypothetical protein [Pseudomonas sp. Larv2_ips]